MSFVTAPAPAAADATMLAALRQDMPFVSAPTHAALAAAPTDAADATIAALRQDMARVSAELDGLLAAFLDVQRAIAALADAPASPVLEPIERAPAKPAEAAPASVWDNAVWYVYDLEADAESSVSETADDDWTAVLPLLHEFDRVSVIQPFADEAEDNWSAVLPFLHEFDRVTVIKPFADEPEIEDDWSSVLPFLHEFDRVSTITPFADEPEVKDNWSVGRSLLREFARKSKAAAPTLASIAEEHRPLFGFTHNFPLVFAPMSAPYVWQPACTSTVTLLGKQIAVPSMLPEWENFHRRALERMANRVKTPAPVEAGDRAADIAAADDVRSTDIVAVPAPSAAEPAIDNTPAYNKLPPEVLYAVAKPKAQPAPRRPKKSIEKQIAKKGFEYFVLSARANVRLNSAWQFAADVRVAAARVSRSTSGRDKAAALVSMRPLVQQVFFVLLLLIQPRVPAEAPLAVEVD